MFLKKPLGDKFMNQRNNQKGGGGIDWGAVSLAGAKKTEKDIKRGGKSRRREKGSSLATRKRDMERPIVRG